jgi:glycosyltransferase 2 family protein
LKKHHLGIAVTVLAVVAAGAFLYTRLGESGFAWSAFKTVMAAMRLQWMAAALPLILSAYLVRALRWKVMIRPLAPKATFWQMTVATFIGFTAVVLFGRAGEPVRPYLIARRQGIPFSSQVAAWLVERILDLLMVLALFGVSLAQLSDEGWSPASKMHTALRAGGWAAGVAGAGCLLALIALRQYRGRIRARLEEALVFLPEKPLARIRGFIHAFDEGMQSTREPKLVWSLVLLTMLEWALVGGSFLSVLQAFPAVSHLSISEALTTMGFVTFAGVVQIPGVGGGMQIATVLVLTELYGIRVEAASGVALVIWATNFLVALPLGLGMAFHEGIRWRTMRQMGEEHSLDLQ